MTMDGDDSRYDDVLEILDSSFMAFLNFLDFSH